MARDMGSRSVITLPLLIGLTEHQTDDQHLLGWSAFFISSQLWRCTWPSYAMSRVTNQTRRLLESHGITGYLQANVENTAVSVLGEGYHGSVLSLNSVYKVPCPGKHVYIAPWNISFSRVLVNRHNTGVWATAAREVCCSRACIGTIGPYLVWSDPMWVTVPSCTKKLSRYISMPTILISIRGLVFNIYPSFWSCTLLLPQDK